MKRVGSSGGWVWHWRCLLGRRRWAATRVAIAQWLDTLPGEPDHLLLIGASAGWMMPQGFLHRFRRIDAYDLDPLAAPLFRHHHGAALRARGIRLNFRRLDAIACLAAILAEHPAACVLFDNVLGQLRFVADDLEAVEAQLRAVADQLLGRCWGSVHDLYSGPVAADAHPPAVQSLTAVQSGSGLMADGRSGPALQDFLLQACHARGEWLDHLTGGLLAPGQACQLIHWPFAPGYAHWLQAAWIVPDEGAFDETVFLGEYTTRIDAARSLLRASHGKQEHEPRPPAGVGINP